MEATNHREASREEAAGTSFPPSSGAGSSVAMSLSSPRSSSSPLPVPASLSHAQAAAHTVGERRKSLATAEGSVSPRENGVSKASASSGFEVVSLADCGGEADEEDKSGEDRQEQNVEQGNFVSRTSSSEDLPAPFSEGGDKGDPSCAADNLEETGPGKDTASATVSSEANRPELSFNSLHANLAAAMPDVENLIRGAPDVRPERGAASCSFSGASESKRTPRGDCALDSERLDKANDALEENAAAQGRRLLHRESEANDESRDAPPENSTETGRGEGDRSVGSPGGCSVQLSAPFQTEANGERSARDGATELIREGGLPEAEEKTGRMSEDSQVPSEDDSEKEEESDEEELRTCVSPPWTEQDREGVVACLRPSSHETQADGLLRLSLLNRLWECDSVANPLSFSASAAAARGARVSSVGERGETSCAAPSPDLADGAPAPGTRTLERQTDQTAGVWGDRHEAESGKAGSLSEVDSATFDVQEAKGVVQALRVLDRRMQREKQRAFGQARSALQVSETAGRGREGPKNARAESGDSTGVDQRGGEGTRAEQSRPKRENVEDVDFRQEARCARETGNTEEGDAERCEDEGMETSSRSEASTGAGNGASQTVTDYTPQMDRPLQITACAVTENLQRGIVGSSEGVLLVFDCLDSSRHEERLQEAISRASPLPLFPSLLASRVLDGGNDGGAASKCLLSGASVFQGLAQQTASAGVARGSSVSAPEASSASEDPQCMFLLLGHSAEVSAVSSDLVGKHVASTALDGRLLVHQVPASPPQTQSPSELSPSPSVAGRSAGDGKGRFLDSCAASVASSGGGSGSGKEKVLRASRNSSVGSGAHGWRASVASSFAAASLGSSSAFPAAFVAPPPPPARGDSIASLGTGQASVSSTASHRAASQPSRFVVAEGPLEQPCVQGGSSESARVEDQQQKGQRGGRDPRDRGRSVEDGVLSQTQETRGVAEAESRDREDFVSANGRVETQETCSDLPRGEDAGEGRIAKRTRQTLNSEIFLVSPLWCVVFPQPLLSVALHPLYGDGTDAHGSSAFAVDNRRQTLGAATAARGPSNPKKFQSLFHRFASRASSALPTESGVAPPAAAAPCVSPVRQAVIWGSADGRLVLHRRGFFYSSNSLIHAGEGPVVSVSWRRSLVAWATSLGVKVLDVDMQQKVTFVPKVSPPASDGHSLAVSSHSPLEIRGDGAPRRGQGRPAGARAAEPCHLVWAADDVLCIAWPTLVRVVCIRSQEVLDPQFPEAEANRTFGLSEAAGLGQKTRRSDAGVWGQESAKNATGRSSSRVDRAGPPSGSSGLEVSGAQLAVGQSPVQGATGTSGNLVLQFAEVIFSLTFCDESPLVGLIVAPVGSARVFDECEETPGEEVGRLSPCSWATARKDEGTRASEPSAHTSGFLESDGPSCQQGQQAAAEIRRNSRLLLAAVTLPEGEKRNSETRRRLQIRFVNTDGDVVRVEPLYLFGDEEGGQSLQRSVGPAGAFDADSLETEAADSLRFRVDTEGKRTQVKGDADERKTRRGHRAIETDDTLAAATGGLEQLRHTRLANAPWLEGALLARDAFLWMLRPRNDIDRTLALLSPSRRRSPLWLSEVLRVSGRVSASFQAAVCSRVVVELLASGRRLLAASLIPLIITKEDPTEAWVRLVLLFHSVGALHLLILFVPSPASSSSKQESPSPAVYELLLTLLACCPPEASAPKPGACGDKGGTHEDGETVAEDADGCAAVRDQLRQETRLFSPNSASLLDSRLSEVGRCRASSLCVEEGKENSLLPETNNVEATDRTGDPALVHKTTGGGQGSLGAAAEVRGEVSLSSETPVSSTSTAYAAAFCYAVHHWELPTATALRLLNRLRCFVFGMAPITDIELPSFTQAKLAEQETGEESFFDMCGSESKSLLSLLLPHTPQVARANSETQPRNATQRHSAFGRTVHAEKNEERQDPASFPSSAQATETEKLQSKERAEMRLALGSGDRAAEAIACVLGDAGSGLGGGKKGTVSPSHCAAFCSAVLLDDVPSSREGGKKMSSRPLSSRTRNTTRVALLMRAAASLATALLLFHATFDALLRLRSPDVFAFLASCAARVASARAGSLADSQRRPTASTAGSGSLDQSDRSSLTGLDVGSRLSFAVSASPEGNAGATLRPGRVSWEERGSEGSTQASSLLQRRSSSGLARRAADRTGDGLGCVPRSTPHSGSLSTWQSAEETMRLEEEAATMAAEATLEKVPERAAELLRLSAPQTLQLLTFRVGGTPEGEGAYDSPLTGGGEGLGVLPSFGEETAETKRGSVGSTSARRGIGAVPSGERASSDGERVCGRAFRQREAGPGDERRASSASFLFRIPDVVKALKQAQTPFWLHAYLKELFQVCPEATRTYYSLQLRLFLRFAPHLLLSFLQTADGGYDYNEALAVCRCWGRLSGECREPQRSVSRSSLSAVVPDWSSATPRQPPAILHCEAFLLGRLGRYAEAIHLLLEDLADVPAAVALAWESADRRVWEMLVQAVVQRPCYITELLGALEDHLAAFSAYSRAHAAAGGDPEALDEVLPFGSMSTRDEGGKSPSLDEFWRVASQSRPKEGEEAQSCFFGVGENERPKQSESAGLRPERTPAKGHLPLSVEPMSPLSRGEEGVGEPTEPLGVRGPKEASRRGLGPSSRPASVSPLSPSTCRETLEATAAEAARAAAAIAPLELLKRLPSHALRLVPRLERRLALLFEQRQLCDEFWEVAEQCQEGDLRSLTAELFVRRRRGVAVRPRPACGLSAGQTDPVSAHRVTVEKRRDSERQKTRQLIEAIRKRLKEVRGELDAGESTGQASEPQRDAGGDGDEVGVGSRAQGLRMDGDRRSGRGAQTLINGYRAPQGLRSSTCARESNASTRSLNAEDDSAGPVDSAAGATPTGRDRESNHGQGAGDSGRLETDGEGHGKADEKRKRHQSLLRSFLLPGGSSGRSRKQSSASRWLWGSGSPRAGERGRVVAEDALAPLGEGRESGDTSQDETGSEERKDWSRRMSRGGEMKKGAPSGLGAAMIARPDETSPATRRDREDSETTDETKKIQWRRGGEKPQGERAFSHETRRAQGLLQDFRETDETGRQTTEPFLFLPPATRCVICMRFVDSPPGCRVEWRCSPRAPEGAALPLPAVSDVSPGVSSSPSRDPLSLAPPRGSAWNASWSGGPLSGRARRHRKQAVSAVAFFCGHTAHLACSLAAKEGDPQFPSSSSARPVVALGVRELTSAPRCVSARWPGAGVSPRRARSLGRTLHVGAAESGELSCAETSKAIAGRTHADAGAAGEEVNECEKGRESLACPVCQLTPLTSWTAAWSCYGERKTDMFREDTRDRHSIERAGGCFLEEDSQLFSPVLRERDNGESFVDSLGRLPHTACLRNATNALW
ncbi:hypothetical protein TGP89_224270 [Toxoplasma gondii p89]|uniref:Vps41 beta-propeller domain-containing protein n=1 Tax=Toxoplasma gondii p89 TaxID=943119 RepID=A0A086K9S6_TOXGO|nr:hypothetical protein TGP89_224270 [Toxoplasma gondii p89]